MSSVEHLSKYENQDLHTSGRSHKKGHGSGEPFLSDRQREEALARSEEDQQVAGAKLDKRARGTSASTEASTHQGAERALDGLSGRAENDIIRLLWDSYLPDKNDDLTTRRLDDVMNDFGLWDSGNVKSDHYIAELMRQAHRPQVDCATFIHWWNDHGKRQANKNKSAWYVLEHLRQFFNQRIDVEHSKHTSTAARSAAEACAVSVDTLADVLLSPQWAMLLEQETKHETKKKGGSHDAEKSSSTAGDHKASLSTPEWARETAVKVLDRIGLSSSPSAKYSLMELWWGFACHKKALQLLLPSMHTPSPDLMISRRGSR